MILTTHDMDDIEAICDRVMVVNRGKILSDGTFDDLRRQITPERLLVVDLIGMGAPKIHPAARITDRKGNRVHIQFDPQRVSAADLIKQVTAENEVGDLFVENPPIEEIIARIYEEQSR